MPEKILIIDDDIDSLKLIGLMLQRQGYEVLAASAGAQALAKASAESPDLIILDVMMPDMDGYEVCRRLRAEPRTRGIPIIMFTAKTLIDDKVAGFEAGADDYLTKPTHPAELNSRIKSILSRSITMDNASPSQGKTLAVIGAKGGTGTSTLALNIGAALTKTQKPIVADFRPGMGSMSLFMGVSDHNGMANILTRPTNEINPQTIEPELLSHTSGLRGLLCSISTREAQLRVPVESAVAVVQGLSQLGNPVVFDLGSGYTSLNSKLLPHMDRILLVVEPITSTLSSAHEMLRAIQNEARKPVDIIVVNRALIRNHLHWHQIEDHLGKAILGIISSDPDLTFEAVERGTPIVLLHPTAIIANQIIKLAEDVTA